MTKADPILKWLTLILISVGFLILASASIGITAQRELPAHYFVTRQLLTGGLVGFIAFLIASRVPYKNWRRFSPFIFLLSLVATAAVFIPGIGAEYGGAQRWISIGLVNFQPSEFLKFGYVLYLAAWLSGRGRDITSLKYGFIPFVIITGIAGLLFILQPDIGTLGVLVFSGLLLFLIGGGKWQHVLIAILLGLILLSILVYLEPYRLERILVFANPTYDPQGSGYQVRQSLIAIGSGGIFGRGFGMSRQKFEYLPEPVGDSIFAVAAEEFGFVGSFILAGLFIVFAWRGFRIAAASSELFGKLLGSGLVILIVLQSLINMVALTGLIPLTGLPLLFVSQGGSALAMALLEVGILLSISRRRGL
jgi:cell division protein FtsW